VNFLIIHNVLRFHYFFGDDFKVDCPKGSGNKKNLAEVADFVSTRLVNIFLKDDKGHRPVYANKHRKYAEDPEWRDYIHFYEYFHGDSGSGIGASHQLGWTALVASLINKVGLQGFKLLF
jgi:hypothetical protein